MHGMLVNTIKIIDNEARKRALKKGCVWKSTIFFSNSVSSACAIAHIHCLKMWNFRAGRNPKGVLWEYALESTGECLFFQYT